MFGLIESIQGIATSIQTGSQLSNNYSFSHKRVTLYCIYNYILKRWAKVYLKILKTKTWR